MTRLTRWSPTTWAPSTDVRPFSSDPFFHRLWNLMDWDWERGEAASWIPDVTVLETKDELIVEADIPGIDPKSVDVDLQGQTLTIRAERKEPKREEDAKMLRSGTAYGLMQQSMQLPVRVDPDKVKASATNGVMTIRLAKAREHVGRRIPIESK